MTLDDYAKQLAGLKKSYASNPNGNLDDIRKQGLQVRSQAAGQGFDLGMLEDSANKIGGYSVDPNSAAEQSFRQSTFNTVKSVPTFKDPTLTSVGAGTSGGEPKTQVAATHLEDANRLMVQLEQMVNTPVQFNPESDPTFQAAKTLAADGAKTASRQTLETMNDRGIINSSVTSSQLGQIEQKAQLEPLKLIPQLQANANSLNQQKIQNLSGLIGLQAGAGIDQRNFASDKAFKEAAIDGRYLSPEASGLIDHILSLKQGAENPLVTSDQLKNFGSLADADRANLSSMGYDPSKFGSDVSYVDAAKNKASAGKQTLQAQTNLFNTAYGTGQAYGSLPAGFTDTLKGTQYESLIPFFQSLEGKPNLQKQTFDMNAYNQKVSQGISQQNANSSSQNAGLNQSKFEYDKKSKLATNALISQVNSYGSRDEAIAYLNQHIDELAQDGVEMQTVINSIEKRWPDAKPAAAPKDNTLTVNQHAEDLAMKAHPTDWNELSDAEQQKEIDKVKARLLKK